MASKGAWAGWVAFAGLLLMIIGGLDFLQGLVAVIRDQYYLVGDNGALVLDVSQWGWIMMIWGVVLALVGYGLVSAVSWARWVAILLVGQLRRSARVRRQQRLHAVVAHRDRAEHHRPLALIVRWGDAKEGAGL